MTISDARYAAQIVTSRGKTIQFDSIECMAAHEGRGSLDGDTIARRRVSDFESHMLQDLDLVTIYRSSKYNSPMAAGLAAHASQPLDQTDLTELSYSEVVGYATTLLVKTDSSSAGGLN